MNCVPDLAIHAATVLEVVSILVAYWLGRKHGREDMQRKISGDV